VTYTDAEIIAVGSELLTASKIDTNSLWLTDQMNALGVEVTQKSIVGDDRSRLTAAVAGALERSQIVLITGGLGPTEDDVTRDAVAAALGRGQTFRQDLCDAIADRFQRMKRRMAEINKRQAFLIDDAEPLTNERGTAPGQWIEERGRIVALLPGPPGEMKHVFEAQVLPRLQHLLPPQVIRTRFYRVACMPESDLDQLIAPVYTKYSNPVTTVLAALGDIQVHLRARCATCEEGDLLLAEVGARIEELVGDRIYTDCGRSIEEVIAEFLTSRGETLAVAESATGGLLAGRLTSLAGASQYFNGGLLTYTDMAKQSLLGVSRELLAEHSAVSEPVACAMAHGARTKLSTTYAASVTGYAGPDGGTDRDPVGTFYIGVATPETCVVRRLHFTGDRNRIRTMAVQWTLDLLRRTLLRLPPS
jgi:nicotinamide-nucleotide amidase